MTKGHEVDGQSIRKEVEEQIRGLNPGRELSPEALDYLTDLSLANRAAVRLWKEQAAEGKPRRTIIFSSEEKS